VRGLEEDQILGAALGVVMRGAPSSTALRFRVVASVTDSTAVKLERQCANATLHALACMRRGQSVFYPRAVPDELCATRRETVFDRLQISFASGVR